MSLGRISPVPTTISLSVAAKIASIIVHVDEGLLTPGSGHVFDVMALKSLVDDPEVKAWIESLGPLVPRKRT